MKKDIKDYLHLYLGCQFVMKIDNPNSEHHGQFTAPMYFGSDVLHAALCKGDYKIDPILILRPLSSMTEADGLKIFGSKTKHLLYRKEAKELGADLWLFTANEYTELLKAGFDCHDLIPNNLAINAETLK